jgi:hypothetical protein
MFFHSSAICSQSSFTFSIYVHILSHLYYMFTIFFHIHHICSHCFAPRLCVHNLLSHSICLFTFLHNPTILSQSSFTLSMYVYVHILLTTVKQVSHSEVTSATTAITFSSNVPLYNTYNSHILFYAASLTVYRHDLQLGHVTLSTLTTIVFTAAKT